MRGRKNPVRRLIAVPLSAGLLLSIGCSTANWPVTAKQMIFQGEKAVSDAKASNASIHAADELTAAEEKLSLAKKEFAKGWHNDAARLAQEAVVDAEYARAKATTEKDKKTLMEIQKNIDSLRQEIGQQPQ